MFVAIKKITFIINKFFTTGGMFAKGDDPNLLMFNIATATYFSNF